MPKPCGCRGKTDTQREAEVARNQKAKEEYLAKQTTDRKRVTRRTQRAAAHAR